ncbi:MAG: DUF2156 domain-containing protein [Armatimonadetes bacterium]|nr:DUF2156 domain-containing protein [Armatimonadota bacterium]
MAADPHVREIVSTHGWNTTCWQILNPGMSTWTSGRTDAAVGFVRRKGVRVVAGAPVCPLADLDKVVQEWEAADGRSPTCYFGAEARLHGYFAGRGDSSIVVMGAQPVWRPESWSAALLGHGTLRAQLSRARNKGVTVEEWPISEVAGNPDLQACLEDWLSTRGLPPLHFLVEPAILDDPVGRRVFVALRDSRPVGFVAMAPVPSRNGWLTEMFVRGNGAVNGTVELALTTAVEAVAADGAAFVTMGMVPLSTHAGVAATVNPAWLRGLSAWSRAHLKRFYDFDGLDRFKSKFRPDAWEPIYVISRERRFSPRTLMAVLSAFTASDPLVTLAGGLLKAVRQEAGWILRPREGGR